MSSTSSNSIRGSIMPLPIRHLPVLQNWDCHVSGNCCKEYQVTLTEEERQRIEAQGWKPEDVGGLPLFSKSGPPWSRKVHLHRRKDGSCVFLSDEGRCRIHERFGYETKPLPCRLFPFVLIPVADHWRVGIRYACPSAAANKGRSLAGHDDALKQFAAELAQREGLEASPDGSLVPPPALQSGQRVEWTDLLRFVNALLVLLRNRQDRIERRLRKCLALAQICRQARFDQIKGNRLIEFLTLLTMGLDADVPADPATLPPPSWIGRLLFRQAVALYSRKDYGPNRGLAARGRLALLAAAWRYAHGRGAVPRMNGWMPETTFEAVEAMRGQPSDAAEELLERYYVIKVSSLQFCGPSNFRLSFWEGLESLLLTYPVLLWVARTFPDRSRDEALLQSVSIVDDHFGFNRVLGTRRQRLSFQLLVRLRELGKLIAWYSR